ncbi:2-phospho-L-lactate transferase [Leisingera daeponensis]|uniref:2-phospho-L-lactate transferase n=1 Tax=Leisingera daeponensis TaxID=405746 RepID=UPI001C93DB3F|nr:2-phospho-L-lactate transferase [Leisingera daeponensis]MBY6058765.1 2-phospho-L-lactate transferase [Leisingera daeponensis]
MTVKHFEGKIAALCGGVGGAKLALGLSCVLAPEQLSIIVNTADDFEHLGLSISPDIDTVTYTLSETVNPETGWGRKDESWRFMESLERLGGETWFSLGDTDLATHAIRTARLSGGARLTEVTRDIARALGIAVPILPATDDRLRTIVETDEGALPFQRYFVGRRCQPRALSLRYENAQNAALTPQVVAALEAPDLAAIVICPSNPFLSVDPILAIPDARARIRAAGVPVIAVSPIIGGRAVKGPLSKMMQEFGQPSDVDSIARHYADLADVLIVDEADRDTAFEGPVKHVAKTLMNTLQDRIALAAVVLDLTNELRGIKHE